jgi:hypothetical protein
MVIVDNLTEEDVLILPQCSIHCPHHIRGIQCKSDSRVKTRTAA